MTVQALGYVEIGTGTLEDWARFGPGQLGLMLAERTGTTLAFRMDDRRQRMLVREGGGAPAFGWEVADAAALDAMGARLEAAGITVARGGRALADQRRVAELLVTSDPEGNRVEMFHGAETAERPFVPGRNISGFRTGPLGMGHIVFTMPDITAMVRFYRGVLGFRLSDYIEQPFRAEFMHVNPRHHSLALIQGPRSAFHHVMMEMLSLDDVGQGYDIALGEEGRIATTLGRHTNDFMTSFYAHTPGGFLVEYGWGGRAVEMESWQPVRVDSGPSLWGHERHWQTPEMRAEARRMRLDAAARGERAPVQVLAGNHTLMPGECIFWDAMRAEAAE